MLEDDELGTWPTVEDTKELETWPLLVGTLDENVLEICSAVLLLGTLVVKTGGSSEDEVVVVVVRVVLKNGVGTPLAQDLLVLAGSG